MNKDTVIARTSLFAISVFFCGVLFAGNWTLDGTTLTDGNDWEFSGAGLAGTTLTIGACTRASSDGVLDFRNAVVNGTTIKLVKIASGTSWASSGIREFYCDSLEKVIGSLFKSCTTIEKFCVSALGNASINASAFQGCTSLKEVSFGRTITVAIDAFNGCVNLEVDVSSLVGKNTASLATRGFQNCSKLHGRLVLSNINSFSSAGSCFSGTGIEELVIDSENDAFTTFSTASFTGCKKLTNVVIKSTKFVNLPKQGVFSGCTSLKKVRLELPNLSSCTPGSGANRLFRGCSSLSEVTIASSPWKDSSGNDLTDTIFTTHVLTGVAHVDSTADAPKKCKVYAVRNEFSRFASAMSANERLHAPPKCYGVYADTDQSRKAYMVQDPEFKSGFSVTIN